MPKTTTKKVTKPRTKTASPSPKARARAAYRLRRSTVHGTGVFAARTIAKGEELIEYVGEYISHDEADRRHADKADDDNHTLLFIIDAKTVIDGGVRGNDARFINHSCDPNCEVVLVNGRPIVEALRTIRPGEELAYDYNLSRSPDDAPDIEKIFACRCGTAACRGTMLTPRKKPKAKAKAKPKPKAKAKPKTKAGASSRGRRTGTRPSARA